MEQTNVERRAVVGSLRSESEVAELRDPFAEAPFYGAGKGSDTVIGLEVGDTIAAIFHGVTQGKTGKKSWYAKLITDSGEKIRLFTGANLLGQLRSRDTGDYRVQPGTYVEITYLGMEVVEGYNDGKPMHQYNLRIGKEALN